MAGFVYFVPNGPQVLSREHLRSLGFEHADSAGTPGCPVNTIGPGGDPGCTFGLGSPTCPGGVSADVGYYTSREEPDKNPQTWKEILGGKMWLGWANANPPTPADLQRKETTGHALTLGDGNEWIIPVYANVPAYNGAHDADVTHKTLIEATTLPTTLGVDGNGTVVQQQVLPRFARIWSLTQLAFRVVTEVNLDLMSAQDMFDFACLALGQNYHLSTWEVTALGLITTENIACVCGAVLGVSQSAIEKAAV